MVAILLLFFGMMVGLQAQSPPIITTNDVFIQAEAKQLPLQFQMEYVTNHGESHTILWTKSKATTPFNVYTYNPENQYIAPHYINNNFQPQIYIGKLLNATESHIARLHVFNDEAVIVLSSNQLGNVFIAKRRDEPIKYNSEAPFLSKKIARTACSPSETTHSLNEPKFRSAGGSTCKKVYLSITVDYDLYEQFGKSASAVSNYVYSVISTVQAIYRLEEVQLGVSEVIIHTKEDGFRHITALDDLNFFRFIRRTFRGDIALCLGGFKDVTGFAPLGGHAFLSSLCFKTTSYAYINVDGSYKSFPNFSWDIFGIAHELGHVLGSRHTHACVWGPHSNKALDNCAATEGGCAPGPSVSKGTIMSYCHLPGKPGVSFASGFGDEPGDLIRSKIANAACLSEYIPDAVPPQSPSEYIANMECFDGTYTHYYDDNNTSSESDDKLILSIKKNNQDIGNVYDGTLLIKTSYTSQSKSGQGKRITAAYVRSGEKFYAGHKYWEITPLRQPSSPVQVKIPVQNKDILDLDNSVPQKVLAGDVDIFSMKAPANPDPMTNHRGATTSRIQMYDKGFSPSSTKFSHHRLGQIEYYEFQTKTLHGGGIGVYEQVILPVDLISFEGQRNDDAAQLNWQVANQVALLGYGIERSLDGLNFNEIGFQSAIKDQDQYSFIDIENQGLAYYYRLKMKDQDGSQKYSNIVFLEEIEKHHEVISLFNSIVSDQQMSISLPNDEEVIARLIHPSSQEVISWKISNPSKRTNLDLPRSLTSGVYLLYVEQGHIQQNFKVFVKN